MAQACYSIKTKIIIFTMILQNLQFSCKCWYNCLHN